MTVARRAMDRTKTTTLHTIIVKKVPSIMESVAHLRHVSCIVISHVLGTGFPEQAFFSKHGRITASATVSTLDRFTLARSALALRPLGNES